MTADQLTIAGREYQSRLLVGTGRYASLEQARQAIVAARAEIVTVGTELLLGETVDTNGATLAAALAARGVDVYWSLRVGDNRARIREALEVGLARSDLVLTTGGLGPTDDDVTREAIAEVLGETPVVDPGLEADLRAFFARTGRTMPERNVKQAWVTPSVTPLANPHGTAPGWLAHLERGGAPKVVAALPGPPGELGPMLHERLLPRLSLPAARLWTRTFKTWGVGESHVADQLGALAAHLVVETPLAVREIVRA